MVGSASPLIVVVLAVALLFARALRLGGPERHGRRGRRARASEEATFTAERHQVRFVQQGIPAHPFWAVSLYDEGPSGRPTRYEVYLVDATTGEVTCKASVLTPAATCGTSYVGSLHTAGINAVGSLHGTRRTPFRTVARYLAAA